MQLSSDKGILNSKETVLTTMNILSWDQCILSMFQYAYEINMEMYISHVKSTCRQFCHQSHPILQSKHLSSQCSLMLLSTLMFPLHCLHREMNDYARGGYKPWKNVQTHLANTHSICDLFCTSPYRQLVEPKSGFLLCLF